MSDDVVQIRERACLWCEEGMYEALPIRHDADLSNFGFKGFTATSGVSFAVAQCDRCGNVQVFRRQRDDEN